MSMYIDKGRWWVECDQCHIGAIPVGVVLNTTRQQARRNAINQHYELIRIPEGRYVGDKVVCADCQSHVEDEEYDVSLEINHDH